MLISRKHKFIYVHIYKTAGSTITDLLADYVDVFTDQSQKKGFGWQGTFHFCGQHCTLEEGLKNLETEKYGIDYRDFFMFTFVRNPYDWVFSVWNNFYRSQFGNTRVYKNPLLQALKKAKIMYRNKIQKKIHCLGRIP